MTITSIIPTSGSIIQTGSTVTLTNTIGETVVSLTLDRSGTGGSNEVIWTPGGGYDTPYTGSRILDGAEETFTFRRTAGWDSTPFQIAVVTATASEEVTYILLAEGEYPPYMQPFNDPLGEQGDGTTLTVKDSGTLKGLAQALDFNDNLTVTEVGPNEFTVDGPAGGGTASTLDQVITAGTLDNDVTVPATNPVILRDGGASLTPLSIERTGAEVGEDDPALLLTTPLLGNPIKIVDSDFGLEMRVNVSGITGPGVNLNLLGGTNTDGSPGTTTVQGPDTTTASTKGGLARVWGGTASGATSDGGDVELSGGLPNSGVAGDILIGSLNKNPSFTNEILFLKGFSVVESADHPLAPVAGKGQHWVRSADGKPIFTDEGGTDWDLTSGGGGSAITVTDEGGPALTAAAASFDFVGPRVSASAVGDDVTVAVSDLVIYPGTSEWISKVTEYTSSATTFNGEFVANGATPSVTTSLSVSYRGADNLTNKALFDELMVGDALVLTRSAVADPVEFLINGTVTYDAGSGAYTIPVANGTGSDTAFGTATYTWWIHKMPTAGGGGAAVWGTITGTLSNQTDLQAALDAKPNMFIQTADPTIADGAVDGDFWIEI